MENQKKISSAFDLESRILELQLENEMFLTKMKTDLTSISTYLPNTSFSEKLSLNSLASITDQLSKKGLTLGLLIPLVLNNTVLRKKSTMIKTLVTSASVLLSDNLTFYDIKTSVKKLFSRKSVTKKKTKATITEPIITPVEVVSSPI